MIRKLLTVWLLCLLLVRVTASLWIMAGFYLQQEEIARTKCVNRFDLIPVCKGQCYLVNQLKQNDKKEQTVPDVRPQEFQVFLYTHCLFEFPGLMTAERNPCPVYRHAGYIQEHNDAIFQPPRLA